MYIYTYMCVVQYIASFLRLFQLLLSEGGSLSSPFDFVDILPTDNLFFLFLRCRLLLGRQRIAKSTSNRDRRSQNGVSFHRFLEHNGGNHNNDDAFCGIQNRGSNSSNCCRESESEFVVNVKKESR
mmetsp:Transcript_21437/g.51091  ORF Transcript_21437/g.51091 Transcript_21437/m.51091 type:complete len:126 (+) Transcript_21437:167-544(+)